MKADRVEILLVEDDLSEIELTIRALKTRNLAGRVLVVKDGTEALEFLFATGPCANRSIKNGPKVAFFDLKLPKVDGRNVLRRIKSDERTRAIPVVVLTSSQDRRDVVESYKLGVNSYIVKPASCNEVVRAVSELATYRLSLNQPLR